MVKSYKQLLIWEKADNLAFIIYKETQHFPPSESYGITSQIRRSALSIPANIVEGFARHNRRELKRFVGIALGSLAETEYFLEFCLKLNYISEETFKKIETVREELGRMLWRFYQKT